MGFYSRHSIDLMFMGLREFRVPGPRRLTTDLRVLDSADHHSGLQLIVFSIASLHGRDDATTERRS